MTILRKWEVLTNIMGRQHSWGIRFGPWETGREVNVMDVSNPS